jgi:hypothetical protein
MVENRQLSELKQRGKKLAGDKGSNKKTQRNTPFSLALGDRSNQHHPTRLQ